MRIVILFLAVSATATLNLYLPLGPWQSVMAVLGFVLLFALLLDLLASNHADVDLHRRTGRE